MICTAGAPEAPGLRGGSVTFEGERIVLRDNRFVEDIAVSGEIRLPGPDGIAHADLTDSTGRQLQLTWRPFQARDIVIASGSVNGRPFHAPVRAVP